MTSGGLGPYARHLAAAMDRRVEELGKRAAAQAPEWASRHLGPVPQTGTSDYEQWVAKAGAVEAYREQYCDGRRADTADPIGRAPSASQSPQKYRDWEIANKALGISREQVKDVMAMSDAALKHTSDRWAAAIEQAPAYVKPLLEEAHTQHRRLAASYERQLAEARVIGPRMQAMAEQVSQAAARVEELMARHSDRQRWYEDTAELRASAREAEAELARRHPESPVKTVGDVREDLDDSAARRADARLLAAEQQQRAVERQGMSLGM